MLDHVKIMEECVSIRRAEHPGWKGDSVFNADTFLNRIGFDMPEDAEILAADLINNKNDWSDILGISPDRVRYYASRLSDGIKSHYIDVYYREKTKTGQPPPSPR